MTNQFRIRPFVRPIALFGVAVPVLVLAALYVAAGAVTVAFGDFVFGLTVVAALAWTLVGISGRRLAAARPDGELHRGSASDYGREVAAGSYARLSAPIRLLLVLTGTVALGWVVVGL